MVYGCTGASDFREPRHKCYKVSCRRLHSNQSHFIAPHRIAPHRHQKKTTKETKRKTIVSYAYACHSGDFGFVLDFFFLTLLICSLLMLWRAHHNLTQHFLFFLFTQRKMVFGLTVKLCAKRQTAKITTSSSITACSIMFGAHFRRHCCVHEVWCVCVCLSSSLSVILFLTTAYRHTYFVLESFTFFASTFFNAAIVVRFFFFFVCLLFSRHFVALAV